ncbi:MAG: MATE family efflux transporter [Firmicutes bacterium HGW-Firmicutes-7]|nr:MAG: MATE family efflux transporter [Firmicutes bacterium HGW-Firmicutes-7]
MDRTKQLGEEKILKLLMTFSIPAIVGMLVNALYNVVDRIFIGNSPDIGKMGIGGITIAFPMMLIMMALAMLVGIGGASMAAIRLGEQKGEEAEKYMGNAIVLLIGISVFSTVVGLIFLEPILEFFGANANLLPYAKNYMQIILLGSIFGGVSFGLNNFIRVDGSPRIAMVTMLIGALINMALDPLFIFVFRWGIRGAAFATIISQAITAVWVIWYFLSNKSHLKIRIPNLTLDPLIVRSIIAIGLPPFMMQMANSLLNIILNNSLMNYGGDLAVAGIGIINSIVLLLLMPVIGISQGAQPIIGYNYGAKNYERVTETLKLAIIGATGIVLIGYLGIRLFPEELIGLFNKDPELLRFGSRALSIFLMFLPIIGFQIIGANYFQAVGKMKPALILTLSRQVLILIPAIIILPRFFGLDGILYAAPVADLSSAILTGTWLFFELRHLRDKADHYVIIDEEVA